MRAETELNYLFPEMKADNPRFWASEGAYIKGDEHGLAGDAGEDVEMLPPGTPGTTIPGTTSTGGMVTTQAMQAKPWYETLVESIVPVAANVYQQKELTKLNTERVRAGLPMISAAEFNKTYQPATASVQVRPDDATQKLLKWGVIGLGVFLGGRLLLQALGRH